VVYEHCRLLLLNLIHSVVVQDIESRGTHIHPSSSTRVAHWCLCVSCVVCRVSCVVCRVSCVVCRVSCVVCRVSCLQRRGRRSWRSTWRRRTWRST
jgi:hypothetical protein